MSDYCLPMPVKPKEEEKYMWDIERLLQYVPIEKQHEFYVYVEDLIKNDEGCDIDMDFLGFMDDYENFAALLKRKADVARSNIFEQLIQNKEKLYERQVAVFDVGCNIALQHVIFDPRIIYFGIDMLPAEPRFFRENCYYIEGRFKDVVHKLEVYKYDSVGIANMSLLYGYRNYEELELFDKTFKKKFIL